MRLSRISYMAGTNYLLLFMLLAVGLQHANGMYDSSDAVVDLTAKNFDSMVSDSNLVSVVEFFAPWCGHCKALAPTFKKVAEKLEGVVKVGAVDCDNERNKPLCAKYQVQGFPTIKIFPALKKKNPYTKKIEKIAQDYQGARTAKGIIAAALAELPSSGVVRIRSSAQLEDYKIATALPLALLLTDKTETPPLYKSLALRFKGRMKLCELRTSDLTEEEVKAIGGLRDLPALMLLKADGTLVQYEGKLKGKELIPFLSDHAAPPGSEEDEPEPTSSDDSAEGKIVPQVVEELPLAGLDNITQADDVYLVAYYSGAAGKDCTAETKKFNEIVAGWGRLTHAAAINLTGEDVEAGSLGIDLASLRAQPCALQITLAPYGEKGDPDEWAAYTGKLESKELQNFALTGFPKFVTRVTDVTIQPFLALDAQRPKVFLFTDKDETPPVFNALAANMRNYKYTFADVHSSQAEVLEKFGVEKTPYMMVGFLAGEKDLGMNADGQSKLSLQRFPGPYKYAMMQAFLQAFATAIGAQPDEGGGDGDGFFSAGAAQPVDVAQVADNAALDAKCLSGSGLCVMAVVDSRSPDFESQLEQVKSVAGRWAKQPLKFFWIDGPSQMSFLEGFGLSADATPALLAFSPAKRRKLVLTGAFDSAGMHAMLDGLFSGTRSTTPFQEIPRLVDGGEEVLPPEAVEEEFDLADILGEEVASPGASKEARMQEVAAQLEKEAAEAAKAAAEKEAKEKEDAAASKKKSKKKKKKGKKSGTTATSEL